MDPQSPDHEERFLIRERCRRHSTIVATLLGGSQLYCGLGSEETRQWSDWDGALIVAKKLDIFGLVNKNRQALMDMFDMTSEEDPRLCVPDPTSERWDDFDAVRFVGYTESGTRKSVKILSLDYFSGSKPSLNISSFKDKRVYEGLTADASRYYQIHQATRLEGSLCILHDQWIFQSEPDICAHGGNINCTAFGVTADLLMSGAWIVGETPHGHSVQTKLLNEYTLASGRHATTQSFARSLRFSLKYRQWLEQRLNLLNSSISVPARCGCVPISSRFLYGSIPRTYTERLPERQSQIRRLPSDLQLSPTTHNPSSEPPVTLSNFTSNSVNYIASLKSDSMVGSVIKVFCKRSKFQDQEIWGARQAALFYPLVQIPVVSLSGDLLYPFFDGWSEAERRLRFVQSGRSDWQQAETILHTELAKAEDMLRAYQHSLQTPAQERGPPEPPINRFYHARLAENHRWKEFYGTQGVEIHGHVLPITSFLSTPIEVNGVAFHSLGTISRDATKTLHPAAVSLCPVIFGLGDTHGANIMISDRQEPDNRRQILYIDYEVAGYHSIMLDLAKPLYNDVLFETLHADSIQDLPRIEYTLEDATFKIKISASADHLGQAILNIKKRYLIEPLFQHAQIVGHSLEKQVPQLASAFFSCACLTRNYDGKWDSLFRNVAVGVTLSQVKDLDGLWACCSSLGLC